MEDGLSERLVTAQSSEDAEDLVELGCDLADDGRHADAETCFRRAVVLGETWASFNLGNALCAQQRWSEAVSAYEVAIEAGEIDAWLNLGHALNQLGDLAGAMRAYRAATDAGDTKGSLELAFMLREQGERAEAERVVQLAANSGDDTARAVLACWVWNRTWDPGLEAALRAGADHYPSARVDLAQLLADTGRTTEAQSVLELGARLGEVECWLPLGNLYWDQLNDQAAAEAAYRGGIAAGDINSHANLGRLLEARGDTRGAETQYRLGAEAGDALSIRVLQELLGRD